MSVQFRTNIDSAKRFMGNISGLPVTEINPLIGDFVRVYSDTNFSLFMKVIERNWIMTNGSSPEVLCYLGPQFDNETIPQFNQRLKDCGFS